MKVEVYEHLFRINSAHGQVVESLRALCQHRAFSQSELDRLRDLSKESRAAINSYLVGLIETAETREAGRRYRRRRSQEKTEEEGR